jgi:hypothetical protein
VVDWRFLTDGQIRVSAGATGIVESKMTATRNASSNLSDGDRADAYGRFVEDYVVGVNHEHHFNFASISTWMARPIAWCVTAWCGAGCRTTIRGGASGWQSRMPSSASRTRN